jgi:hypothetical protein
MKKKPEKDKSGLTAAAEAVGSAAGKIAALVGVKEEPAPARTVVKKAKLEPKHRHRLPRRQKKAQRKALAATAAPKK